MFDDESNRTGMIFYDMPKETGSDFVPIDDRIYSGLLGYPVSIAGITVPACNNRCTVQPVRSRRQGPGKMPACFWKGHCTSNQRWLESGVGTHVEQVKPVDFARVKEEGCIDAWDGKLLSRHKIEFAIFIQDKMTNGC